MEADFRFRFICLAATSFSLLLWYTAIFIARRHSSVWQSAIPLQ